MKRKILSCLLAVIMIAAITLQTAAFDAVQNAETAEESLFDSCCEKIEIFPESSINDFRTGPLTQRFIVNGDEVSISIAEEGCGYHIWNEGPWVDILVGPWMQCAIPAHGNCVVRYIQSRKTLTCQNCGVTSYLYEEVANHRN